MAITIYHNPRCSKSREALSLLRERGVVPQIIEYLQTPPTVAELTALLRKLKAEPAALIRDKEHRALGLPDTNDPDVLLQRLAEYPQIMQRPIVVAGRRACIARPPENLLELLDDAS